MTIHSLKNIQKTGLEGNADQQEKNVVHLFTGWALLKSYETVAGLQGAF